MKILCTLFWHNWDGGFSTAACAFRCLNCGEEKHQTNSYETIESGDRYEKNVCVYCHDNYEVIMDGSPV